jgi:hypothetical protein
MLRVMPTGLLVIGLAVQSPSVFAQPLEVHEVDATRAAVETQVERLVSEVAARDPELAQEIERQSELCLRDLSDGRLEHPEFTKDIETYREVQRDLTERVVQGEVEARIAEAVAAGNRELADSMRTAFEALRAVGELGLGAPELGGGPGGGETIGRDDARRMFEQAYNEALGHDPEGAQRMKEMFEAAERGEFVRPTPEMMERMRDEMGEYLRENPEMREYARVEWDRFMEGGPDRGERFGPTDSPEHAREAFERWASEGGHSPAEMDRMRAEMERGFEMAREWEARGAEFEHYFESPERYFDYQPPERNYEQIQQNQIDFQQGETFVRTDVHVADHNGDGDATDPEDTHMHGVFRHSDGTCHDHATQGTVGC